MNFLSILLLLIIFSITIFIIWKVFIKKDINVCNECNGDCKNCKKINKIQNRDNRRNQK